MEDAGADPFFWATCSAVGIQAATSIFSGHRAGRSPLFVGAALLLWTSGRVVLVLPLCPQPRLDAGGWHLAAGTAVLALGLAVGVAAMWRVRWWSPPREEMTLRTRGVYSLVRHPIYLSEVLWPFGWALVWRSIYGLALVPVWWLVLLVHALAEEAQLDRTLGDAYRAYRARVRGRMLPGLPF